ncbi:MAG: GGDEF domain-containing protein, partial [Deferribacteres bacterium]|nr:GGDEF domain-containing protein [Deferribacteres bacterium]
LMGVIKKIPEKDKLTLEDALKLNEAIIKIRESLEKDVEHVAVKLTSLEDKVRVLKDKMIKEPVSSVKSDIFKEMIEKLILRRKTTGEIFSLLVIRINDWERIKRQFPQNAILDYINRFCLTLKGELRATDIVSYIEEGTFAVALRDVSLRGGMKIAKRLKETMDKFFTVYKGEEISSRVNIAVVEGSPTDTYQSIIERAKKTLKICELDGGDCIRSELDLVGRE